MPDWEQKQAKFDQLPVDVETINHAIRHLNTTVSRLGGAVEGLEADIRVMVMLLSRVEQCVQEQTKVLRALHAANPTAPEG